MATKNIVPRANHEGQIGTSAKSWSKVYATGIIGDMIAGSGTGGTFDTFPATYSKPTHQLKRYQCLTMVRRAN